jgi:hypothetical protein
VGNRLNLLFGGIAVLIVAAVAAIVIIDPFSSSAVSSPSAAATAAPSLAVQPVRPAPDVSTTVNPSQAPTPPATGAYFGAWVGPDNFTQANEINAVNSLQQELGRKLGIVHTYLKWQAPFPTVSDRTFLSQGLTLLISWAGTDTKQIISGTDDAWIRTRAQQIKALDKPVYLEWRWEMDRPNLHDQMHSGADYVAAWDHIRAIFASVGVQNAAWVWCPTGKGFTDGRAAAYYPGDKEVDWICTDAYPYGSYVSFAATVNPFLRWASHHGKPVMIGEYGVPETDTGQQRAQWLNAMQQVVRADQQIKAVLYFDADSPGQITYALRGGKALAAFRSIARQPYFNPSGGH